MKPTRIEFIKEDPLFMWDVGDIHDIGKFGVVDVCMKGPNAFMIKTQLSSTDLIELGYAKYVELKKKYGEMKGDYTIGMNENYNEKVKIEGVFNKYCFPNYESRNGFARWVNASCKIYQWCEDCKKENPVKDELWQVVLDREGEFLVVGGYFWQSTGPFSFATKDLAFQCLDELKEEWLVYLGRK